MQAFDALSPQEQLDLIGELWERIRARPEGVPVREDHLVEMRRRYQQHLEDPDSALSHEEVFRSFPDDG